MPAGGTLGNGQSFSTTSNFGINFGSGAPDKAMAKGSIYLRSDGTGATHYNADGTAGGSTEIGAVVRRSAWALLRRAVRPLEPSGGTPTPLSAAAELFIYYNDGTSSQWVPASPGAAALTTPGGDFMAINNANIGLPTNTRSL